MAGSRWGERLATCSPTWSMGRAARGEHGRWAQPVRRPCNPRSGFPRCDQPVAVVTGRPRLEICRQLKAGVDVVLTAATPRRDRRPTELRVRFPCSTSPAGSASMSWPVAGAGAGHLGYPRQQRPASYCRRRPHIRRMQDDHDQRCWPPTPPRRSASPQTLMPLLLRAANRARGQHFERPGTHVAHGRRHARVPVSRLRSTPPPRCSPRKSGTPVRSMPAARAGWLPTWAAPKRRKACAKAPTPQCGLSLLPDNGPPAASSGPPAHRLVTPPGRGAVAMIRRAVR